MRERMLGEKVEMNIQSLLDFQIGIEERISRIYQSIAHHFSEGLERDTEWIAFWKALAVDEAQHAALLSIEKEFLETGVRAEKPVALDPATRKELDLLLTRCEERIGSGVTEAEAIEILSALETSEVNEIFASLLEATDSKVLTYFSVFSQAHREHERRIEDGINKYAVLLQNASPLKKIKEVQDAPFPSKTPGDQRLS